MGTLQIPPPLQLGNFYKETYLYADNFSRYYKILSELSIGESLL